MTSEGFWQNSEKPSWRMWFVVVCYPPYYHKPTKPLPDTKIKNFCARFGKFRAITDEENEKQKCYAEVPFLHMSEGVKWCYISFL